MARILPLLLLLLLASTDAIGARPGITWRDLVQVRKVFSPIIADDGSWVAVEARPDRGDGEVQFQRTDGKRSWSIPRATGPMLSADGRFGAAKEQPSFEARETSDEPDTLQSFAVLIDLESGEQKRFEDPEDFGFSADGQWFAVRLKAAEEEETEADEDADPAADETEAEDEPEPREAGTLLTVIRLEDGVSQEHEDVRSFHWSGVGAALALVQETATGLGNRLSVVDYGSGTEPLAVDAADSATWNAVAWAEELPLLGAVAADARDPEDPVDARLIEFDLATGQTRQRIRFDEVELGWNLPWDNQLSFSRDGKRLYFGLRVAKPEATEEEERAFDILDTEALLAERGLDVWHWRDPRVKTNERSTYEERSKHRYLAVVHRETGAVVRVAGPELESVEPPDEGTIALGRGPATLAARAHLGRVLRGSLGRRPQ